MWRHCFTLWMRNLASAVRYRMRYSENDGDDVVLRWHASREARALTEHAHFLKSLVLRRRSVPGPLRIVVVPFSRQLRASMQSCKTRRAVVTGIHRRTPSSDYVQLVSPMAVSAASPSPSSPGASPATGATTDVEGLSTSRRFRSISPTWTVSSSRPQDEVQTPTVPTPTVPRLDEAPCSGSTRKTSTLAPASIQGPATSNGLREACGSVLKVTPDASLREASEQRTENIYIKSTDRSFEKGDNTEKASQKSAYHLTTRTREGEPQNNLSNSLNNATKLDSPSILEKLTQRIPKLPFDTLWIASGNTANATFHHNGLKSAGTLTNKPIEDSTETTENGTENIAHNTTVRASQQISGMAWCTVGKTNSKMTLDKTREDALVDSLEGTLHNRASRGINRVRELKTSLPRFPPRAQSLAPVHWTQSSVSCVTKERRHIYRGPMVSTSASEAPKSMVRVRDASPSTKRKGIFSNYSNRPAKNVDGKFRKRSDAIRTFSLMRLSHTPSEHELRQWKGRTPVDIVPTNRTEGTEMGVATIRSTRYRRGSTREAVDGVALISQNATTIPRQNVKGRQYSATSTHVLQPQREVHVMKKELWLYPLALCIVLFTIAFVVLFLRGPVRKADFNLKEKRIPEPCSARNCIQEANYLSKLLTLALHPCDNFYRFVCDRPAIRYSILRGAHAVPTYDHVETLEARMYSLFTSGKRTDVAPALKSLFHQCSNGRQTDEDGWKPMRELMSQVSLQGFPLTPPIEDVSVWKVAAQLLRKTGTAAFFSVGIAPHPSTTDDIAFLDLPEALSMIVCVETSEINRIYTKAVFYSISALSERQVPSVHTLYVVRFASELERLHQLHQSNRTSYLLKFSPGSPVDDFLAEVFMDVLGEVYAPGGDSEVIINAPEFLSELQRLVNNTELHTVMNFLGVRLVIQMAAFLPWSELHDVFSSLVYRRSRVGVERWRFCLRAVEEALPSLFLQSSLLAIGNRDLLTTSTKLVTAIRREFLRTVHDTIYLSDASKTAIEAIISNTKFKVLGASWIYSRNLDMQIDDPEVYQKGSALHSYVSAHEITFTTKLARGSLNEWPLSAFSTDCWYERGTKTIYVPMLVFNVSLTVSDTAQIARAGMRIGRIIFHMLLSEASSKEASHQWLKDDEGYVTAIVRRCFSELEQAQVMEALRDALVTRVAYDHFQRVTGGLNKRLRLQLGTDQIIMEAEQLFFVYLVLQLCETRCGAAKLETSSEVLWNTVLRHEPGFHKAFRCRPGTFMNPVDQCGLTPLNSLYYAYFSSQVA